MQRFRVLAGIFIVAFAAIATAKSSTQGLVNSLYTGSASAAASTPKRPVTVRDTIEFTSLADPAYLWSGDSLGKVASFSPDGATFAIVTRHGDLQEMVNVFDLFIFRSTDVLRGTAKPFLHLTFKSSSNRAGVHSLMWSHNGRALYFIGEQPGEVGQLMRLDLASGVVQTLTHSRTAVLSYGYNDDGGPIVYVAEAEWRSFWDEATERSGFVISNQSLQDLISGRAGYGSLGLQDESDLFEQGGSGVHKIVLEEPMDSYAADAPDDILSLSPDGKHVIVLAALRLGDVPKAWRASRLPWVKDNFVFDDASLQKTLSIFHIYEIVTLGTNQSRPLLDVPAVEIAAARPVWVRDGRAVVLRSYMPSDFSSKSEAQESDNPQSIEVEIATGRVTPIGANCFAPIGWNPEKHLLECQTNPALHACNAGRGIAFFNCQKHVDKGLKEQRDIFFERTQTGWVERRQGIPVVRRLMIFLREDFRTPPHVIAEDRVTGYQYTLLDFNPQLKNLILGRVDNLTWRDPDGRQGHAGLYYPIGYHPGRRYPLVIQTHGWVPTRFQLEGLDGTGYEAQPLAARGFFVLQLDDMRWDEATFHPQKEVQTVIAIYRMVINNLVHKGFVDKARVGVLGWSHTCFYVKYALAHTNLFAAATIADGEDGGYLQYVTSDNAWVNANAMYGGGPYGAILLNWFKKSPGFNLLNVKAPVRITIVQPYSLFVDWEWFHGLSDLHKPVDMLMFKDGLHMLQKPSERLVTGESNVDWFDFWLNGHEDPNPAKAAQYRRWAGLRKLQQ